MRQGKISKIIKNSEDIKETLEKVQELDGHKVEKFEDYYKAYQEDKSKNGFPFNAKNFEEKLKKAEASVQDVESACNWYELAKELDTLDIDSSKINSLTVKGAVLIIENAYDNLAQDVEKKIEDKLDEQERQQSQRQIQQQRR